ncbi:MAG TPA: glycosyl hydrolase family 8 [Polyangia bacterium]|nr:glycosyl hydrolase family 8 [Polyangia bacterium]
MCGSGQTCTNGSCVGGGGGVGGQTGTAGTTGGQAGTTGGGGSTRPAGCAAGPDTISDFEEGTTGITIPQAGRQGWWYTFSDPAAGQQTPARNAAGPVMTAMADGTDPNAGTCGMNRWAMHSTSSGHINYVGFGTSLAQVLPAPPATAMTTKTKNPYDATTSMYDGVVFDIKSGSGTAPNIWFELLNSENQPQPDGTIRTADGTAAGAAQSPSSNATDEYNTRGKLLTNVTTTWQTVYVPFGLLAPRYLPAQATTGPCANGAIFCEAPGFNPKSMLGLQFSVYDQFPKAGTTAGTYDLWVDNVAFYKGTNGIATFMPSAGTTKMFPQDSAMVGACPKPAGAAGKFLVDMYLRWKNTFVTNNPTRVVRPENGNDTVSEGIGYGMLIAVYMGDRTLFDGLYSYWTSHSAGGSASTLMTWCIPAGGGSCPATGGTATDADEDVAFALIQAGKQWGSATYTTAATAMVKQIYAVDIDAATGIPKGGSNYSSPNPTNPSYFTPAYYRVFAGIDTANPWNNVVTASYTALKANAATFGGGLVSAWCSNGCGQLAANSGSAQPADDMKYQYDAHRVPWRFGLDACWNSTSANAADARTFLGANTAFFARQATNGVGRVFSIYQSAGATPLVSTSSQPPATPNSMSVVGTAAVGAMATASTNATAKAFLDRAYRFILDASYTSDPASATTGYTYFNATVGLITALTMSGNFNNF